MGLEQDASGNWVFTNPTQAFIDTDSFSTADPAFQYAPTDDATEDDQEEDFSPCPAGYIYDSTLKQCVPDPNYQAPSFLGEPTGGTEPDQPGLHIPSNETKEHWINNANTIITEGEGAGTGKTGLQLFIDNLDDRGFIKNENGKIIFEKDIKGSSIYQGMANILGHQAKVDKIVHDLQRMGAINAEVTLNEKGDMVYTSEMELSDHAFAFTTYNYDATGEYTGFTTPDGKKFTKTGTFGTAGYESAWEKYMNEMAKVKTSVTKPVEDVEAELAKEILFGLYDEEKKKEEEKERKAKADQLRREAEEDQIKKEKERREFEDLQPGQSVTDSSGDTYTKKDDGGYAFTPKETKSAVSRITETGVNYGTGRGGTATQQQQMKQQDTRPKQRDYTKHHAYGL